MRRSWLHLALLLGSTISAIAQQETQPPTLRLPRLAEPKSIEAALQIEPGNDQFRGQIKLEVSILSDTPVLWLNARELELQTGRITDRGGAQAIRLQPVGGDYVSLKADRAFKKGSARIEIEYSGTVSRILTDGAFQQKQGDDWYVFTKFEPVTARRVFPCFDEPSYKVPWQLNLTFPKAFKAYSNTPVKERKQVGEDKQSVEFEQTRPLPSYLVAFAIGPFEEVATAPIGKNHVPGHIIVPRARAEEARYAAAVTPDLISLLETYFGRPYPYEKLDQIVVPVTTAWGAMENAGLIAYGNFLLSPSTQETELWHRRTAALMEHEMAHQWFGDLVTMAWWDDLWLNEAFASWVETRLLNQWKPEWNAEANFTRSSQVLELDSLTTARKIRQPIQAPGDIGNAFDAITYGKGQGVIGMFENYVGSTAFQEAVHRYLMQHEWRNATSNDLLASIDAVAPGKQAGSAFSTFLNQTGFPLIGVDQECQGANTYVQVTQTRFVPVGSKEAAQETWQAPVCSVWQDNSGEHRQCDLLSQNSMTFALKSARSCPAWLDADSNGAGYFAIEYQSDLSSRLMQSGLDTLSQVERAALLRNVQLLFSSGVGNIQHDLSIASSASKMSDLGLVRQTADLVLSARPFVTPEARGQYAKWICSLYLTRAHELGWKPKPGENIETASLRQVLLPLVATEGGDEELQHQAVVLAESWLKTRTGLDPDVVSDVLYTAAWHSNQAYFDQLVNAIRSDPVQRERARMIAGLSGFQNRDLVKAGLNLLFEPGIDPRELQRLIFNAGETTRETVWNFVKDNFERLNTTLPSARNVPFGATLPRAASHFCEAGRAAEVEQFFAPKIQSLPGGARYLANSLESIRLCSVRAEVIRPVLTKYLEQQ